MAGWEMNTNTAQSGKRTKKAIMGREEKKSPRCGECGVGRLTLLMSGGKQTVHQKWEEKEKVLEERKEIR
jgi:hypothetical protein